MALPLAVLGLSSVLVATSGGAGATLPGGSTFESGDGNLASNGATDWNTLPSSRLSCVTPILNCGLDLPTGQTDDSFGQGTSEDTAVPSVVDGSIPNNKSDLTRFYVAKEFVNNKNYLYLAWERVQEPTGTTNMDFEFNQSRTVSSNGVTPVRTAGDLLINYDLSQGGTNPSLGYRTWITAGNAATLCEASNKLPCWSKVNSLSGFFEGAVNTAALTNGDTIGPNAPRSLSARTFGEAGIDLTGSGILPANVCTGFGRAYLKSRSSDSFTSALKDFIAPIGVDINNCAPAELKIKKVDSSNTSTNLAGAVFQLYKDSATGTANVIDASDTLVSPDVPTGTATTCTTTSDGIGNCVYTLLASAASNGTYLAREVTAPTGYNGAADQSHAVTIGASATTFTFTFLDAAAPGTVTVLKRGAPGSVPLAGAVFKLVARADLALTAPTAAERAATGVGSCTTVVTVPPAAPPAGGQGSCSIANVPLGDYWLIEVTPPTNYFLSNPDYQAVTVGLGGTPGVGQTVTKTFSNPPKLVVITVVCNQATGTLSPASATLDGDTKSTLTTAGLANAALEAQVCALGGARFPDKAGGVQLNGSVTP